MKSLENYLEPRRTELLKECGAFFAFSQKQFARQKQDGVTYCSLGAGLISPKGSAKKLMNGLQRIWEEGIAQDLAENSKEAIILRELNNYECFYTGDITDCAEALKDYGIKTEEIMEAFLHTQRSS
jgi:hypothetical protein